MLGLGWLFVSVVVPSGPPWTGGGTDFSLLFPPSAAALLIRVDLRPFAVPPSCYFVQFVVYFFSFIHAHSRSAER